MGHKDELYMDSIEFNSKAKIKRSKNILNELYDMDEAVSLPSAIYTKSKEEKKESKKKQKEEKKNSIVDFDTSDDWLDTVASFKVPKTKKKGKNIFDGFELGDKKKKKKSKSKDGKIVNHKKDFEPELALLRSLQLDQSRFVDSLQKKYDQMENTKSTARGVGKFTTDLIDSITSARSVSMQLVDKIISTKKTIADLDFKERKEFGQQSNSAQQNLTNYASTYLKQVVDAGRNSIVGAAEGYASFDDISDEDTDDIILSIDSNLGDNDRDKDAELYLKYENSDISVKVIWYDDRDDNDLDKKYEFVAYDKHGIEVDDYPLPQKTKLNINRSTNMCSDIYGNKYEMIIM